MISYITYGYFWHHLVINIDGIINIQDLVLMVSFIVGDSDVISFESWIADINSDLIINVLDIVLVVNIIMGEE